MEVLFEVIGWTGSFVIVATYALNSYQKINSDSVHFYLLNLAGGILLIIYSNYKAANANTFINVVWVLVALLALLKKIKTKKL